MSDQAGGGVRVGGLDGAGLLSRIRLRPEAPLPVQAVMPAPPCTLIERLGQPLDPVAALLLEQANAGVLVTDRSGLLLRVNSRFCRMADRSPDALQGTLAVQLFAAEAREPVSIRLQAAVLSAAAPLNMVVQLDHDGLGGGAELELSICPLCESDGSVAGLMLRLEDLTGRRRLEAQLAQCQKLQALGQLAAGVAHDFNNLLSAMLAAADTITARPEAAPATLQDAAEIRQNAERGAALVRQLFAFGRQQTLDPQPIPVHGAIFNLTGLLRRLLGTQIALELDLQPLECTARVDPTQLDQVLVNLAVNARDAMPGGGTLTLRTGQITLFRPLMRGSDTVPPGRYVMIEVQDTGCGIPAELLPQIFEPFVSTRRDHGGTGLGLSTVHGIIRQSHGFIGVETELGHGTRMRVYLPHADAAMPAAAAAPPAPVANQAIVPRPTVLLVDDEAAIRRFAECALAQAGFTVLAADSAEAALELVDTCAVQVDLVISDVVMPGLDGAALVLHLRQRWCCLPVLLVSGYADERLRQILEQTGAKFLHKPYRLSELVRVAEQLTCKTGPRPGGPPS